MATKITAEQLKKLKALGVKAKDVDGARKELIKLLAKKDVDGVEKDSLDELIEMYEAFFEPEEEETEEETTEEEETEEETTEEEEIDEAAEETEEEDETEESDDDDTEEEEEETTPKKKVAAKADVKKPVAEKAKSTEKATKKPAKEKFTAWTSDSKDNKKAIKGIVDLFEGSEVKYLKNGITIFHVGKSSKRAIISFDRVKIKEDGEVVGDLFFNALKGKEEVHEKIGEGRDYKHFNANLLFLSKLSVEEAIEILEEGDLITHMVKKLSNSDTRALKNREKLEDKMKGEGKKDDKKVSKAIPTKAKAKIVDEEEETEEEETEEEEVVKKPLMKRK